MSKLSLIVLAMIAAASPIAVVAGSGVARADVSAGDRCSVWHATARDASGTLLTCNPTMTTDKTTGQKILVWQTGGPG